MDAGAVTQIAQDVFAGSQPELHLCLIGKRGSMPSGGYCDVFQKELTDWRQKIKALFIYLGRLFIADRIVESSCSLYTASAEITVTGVKLPVLPAAGEGVNLARHVRSPVCRVSNREVDSERRNWSDRLIFTLTCASLFTSSVPSRAPC